MRWELTQTGGLADIAFMLVDVVQSSRELGTYLYRGVRSWSTPAQRMGIISACTCNADHGECFGK